MSEELVRMFRQMGMTNAQINAVLNQRFPNVDPRQWAGTPISETPEGE